jgi:hypothetical protein
MADDPWGKFVPKSNDDPWSQFVAPSQGSPTPPPASGPISPSAPGAVGQASSPGAQPASFNQGPDTLGQMGAFDPRAANSTWSDFLLAHLAELGKAAGQAGQTADDYVRAATNKVLPGDKFAAYMSNLTGVGGGDLASQQAQTAAANQRLGPAGRVASSITGYGPLAALGIAPALGGGVLASGAELATGGALEGAGQSRADTWGGVAKDALTSAAKMGVGGVGVGILGKVANPVMNAVADVIGKPIGRVTGVLATPEEATASTQAAKTAAYDKFDDVLYHPSDIGNGVSDVKGGIYANDVDNNYLKNSPQTAKILDSYADQMNNAALQKQPTTGATLNDTIKQLDSVARKNSSNFEGVAAAQARDGLTDLFHSATPLSAPSNFNVNTALQDAATANAAYKNADFLQQAGQNLTFFGQSPASDAARIAQKFYRQGIADLAAGRPTQDAAIVQRLSKIALAGGGLPSAMALAHAAYPLAEAAGSGLGATFGGPAGAMMGEAVGGLAAAGAKTALSNAMSKAQTAASLKAINHSYPAMTGQSVAFPSIDMNPLMRAILLGSAPYPK